MKYSIKVNEVRAKEGSNIKGFATVVFGDSFKITNIAILENKDKGELFVSMPRYRSNERDESNGVIYKDVCNPITAEFREELYTNILDASWHSCGYCWCECSSERCHPRCRDDCPCR